MQHPICATTCAHQSSWLILTISAALLLAASEVTSGHAAMDETAPREASAAEAAPSPVPPSSGSTEEQRKQTASAEADAGRDGDPQAAELRRRVLLMLYLHSVTSFRGQRDSGVSR